MVNGHSTSKKKKVEDGGNFPDDIQVHENPTPNPAQQEEKDDDVQVLGRKRPSRSRAPNPVLSSIPERPPVQVQHDPMLYNGQGTSDSWATSQLPPLMALSSPEYQWPAFRSGQYFPFAGAAGPIGRFGMDLEGYQEATQGTSSSGLQPSSSESIECLGTVSQTGQYFPFTGVPGPIEGLQSTSNSSELQPSSSESVEYLETVSHTGQLYPLTGVSSGPIDRLQSTSSSGLQPSSSNSVECLGTVSHAGQYFPFAGVPGPTERLQDASQSAGLQPTSSASVEFISISVPAPTKVVALAPRREEPMMRRSAASSATPELSRLLGHLTAESLPNSTPELIRLLARSVDVHPPRPRQIPQVQPRSDSVGNATRGTRKSPATPVLSGTQASSSSIPVDSQKNSTRTISETPQDAPPEISDSVVIAQLHTDARLPADPVYSMGFDKKMELTMPSVCRLRPNIFADDQIVSFAILHIAKEFIHADVINEVLIVSTFLYARLSRLPRGGFSQNAGERREQKLENAKKACRQLNDKKKYMIDIFKKKYLVVPVCNNNHWILVIVANPKGCLTPTNTEPATEQCFVMILDSLGWWTVVEPEETFENIKTFLRVYVELARRPGQPLEREARSFSEERVRCVVPRNPPHQGNFFDCGFYAIHSFERLFAHRRRLLTVEEITTIDWEEHWPDACAMAEMIRSRVFRAVWNSATPDGRQHLSRLEASKRPAERRYRVHSVFAEGRRPRHPEFRKRNLSAEPFVCGRGGGTSSPHFKLREFLMSRPFERLRRRQLRQLHQPETSH